MTGLQLIEQLAEVDRRCFELRKTESRKVVRRFKRQLGIPDQCLCNMLISYNIPFKLYAERKQPFKFYDIDVVREHPKVKELIAKYNR